MKIYCISWKDERWSADKESLNTINKMINKNTKTKNNMQFLLFIPYSIGFIYHGFISFTKWLAKKLKCNAVFILIIFALFICGCESHGWRSVDSCCGHHHHVDHHVDHHHYHHYTPRQIHYHEHVTKQRSQSSRPFPPSRPTSPPSRPISKGVPEPPSREPTRKE